MPFVTVGRENSAAIRIYYEDHGSGSPVVLVHGYALNGHSWEKQEAALLAAGHRVITYDRRGCGASSRPSTGYDFDTLSGDLDVLLSTLDLRGVVLAGFAMETGEVARYLAAHGPGQVKAAVLVAPLLPFLLKTNDNPDGIDRSVFDRLTARVPYQRTFLFVNESSSSGISCHSTFPGFVPNWTLDASRCRSGHDPGTLVGSGPGNLHWHDQPPGASSKRAKQTSWLSWIVTEDSSLQVRDLDRAICVVTGHLGWEATVNWLRRSRGDAAGAEPGA